ncbi:hypothetical protein K438DRAFT_1953009 [Mycena galopus ATCC 62051]|nr:hypothetical protein K438DRAFT_1953009 [Mycena galopus ATCC 62051]
MSHIFSVPGGDNCGPEDPHRKLHCPKTGCSFETFYLKHLEVHVDVAHRENPRPFQCLEDHCGFSTTTQGALTRHYRERHRTEPPSRKLVPLRRRAPRNQQQSQMASTSDLLEPTISSIPRVDPLSSIFRSSSPALSASVLVTETSTAMAPAVTKYYPAAVYRDYPASSPREASPSPDSVSAYLSSLHTRLTAAATSHSTGPHNGSPGPRPNFSSLQCMSPAWDSPDSPPSAAEWVSWRDECDVAEEVLAIATGEQALCERSMMSMTEYLPVQGDIGMAEKRLLWA